MSIENAIFLRQSYIALSSLTLERGFPRIIRCLPQQIYRRIPANSSATAINTAYTCNVTRGKHLLHDKNISLCDSPTS